jgi:hypothetical protein
MWRHPGEPESKIGIVFHHLHLKLAVFVHLRGGRGLLFRRGSLILGGRLASHTLKELLRRFIVPTLAASTFGLCFDEFTAEGFRED